MRPRNLGDIHRSQNGRGADGNAGDTAKYQKGDPIPRKRAAQRGGDKKKRQGTQAVSAAKPTASVTAAGGTYDRSPESNRHGESKGGGRKVEFFSERPGHTGDDGRIEPEEKAAQRSGHRALYDGSVERDLCGAARRDHDVSKIHERPHR
jgi:hypothetical protein